MVVRLDPKEIHYLTILCHVFLTTYYLQMVIVF